MGFGVASFLVDDFAFVRIRFVVSLMSSLADGIQRALM